jgi:Family of unknown function (DUF6496)
VTEPPSSVCFVGRFRQAGAARAGQTSPGDLISFTRAARARDPLTEIPMPEQQTIDRARKDKRQGRSASTQAGEFVRQEMHHIREGKHGARSTKQAIAIGLSEARRAGVDLKPPKKGTTSKKTRKSATRAYARGHGAPARAKSTAKRSRATTQALKREPGSTASPTALARQAKSAAKRRRSSDRSASARKASRTKGPSERSAAARKAARTREARAHA